MLARTFIVFMKSVCCDAFAWDEDFFACLVYPCIVVVCVCVGGSFCKCVCERGGQRHTLLEAGAEFGCGEQDVFLKKERSCFCVRLAVGSRVNAFHIIQRRPVQSERGRKSVR